MVEGLAHGALWHVMCARDILHRRVTAEDFDDTKKYGPYGEFFFLINASRPDRSSSTQAREH